MLNGAKVYLSPVVERREPLLELVEALGGKAVFDPKEAAVIVAPELLGDAPEDAQVLIPTGDVLEAFYLFCLCRRNCFTA